MNAKMIVLKSAALIVLGSSSISLADLANLGTNGGNAATDALTRIAASKHFEGANVAALDPDVDLKEDFVYYSNLDIKGPDLSGGGGAVGAGGGGLGWTDPGDNGVIGGGGGGGSGPGPIDNGTPPVDGRQTPTPGAVILALIGLGCVGGTRRRV